MHLLAASAFAESVRYVSDNGLDSENDCTSITMPCASLTHALFQANDGDTIHLFSLEITEPEIFIDKNIEIIGQGLEHSIIQAAPFPFEASNRVLSIAKARKVRLQNLHIRYGRTPASPHLHEVAGGGIFNSGDLEIVDSIISLNQTGIGLSVEEAQLGHGGGIFSDGILILNRCHISDNSTADSQDNTDVSASGGGLYNSGEATIKLSTFSGNATGRGSEQAGFGGGIYNKGSIEMLNSMIENNRTGEAISAGFGGGVGGGVFNIGDMKIEGCTINNNYTLDGGRGGGLFNFNKLSILNSTISGNSSRSSNDGGDGNGGGLYNHALGVCNLAHCTLTQNRSAGDGGGLSNSGLAGGGPVFIAHAIIAGNQVPPGKKGADCSGVFMSEGYNLIGDEDDCRFAGNLIGNLVSHNPSLGMLSNNGGSTLTHALLAGSPAINAGNPLFVTSPESDQRGLTRVVNNRIDIGAYEANTNSFIAYNDLSWSEDQVLYNNTTRYTSSEGLGVPTEGSSGFLKDFNSGQTIRAMLKVEGGAWNGENHTSFGSLSEPGTEAYELFNDKLDAQGVLSYGDSNIVLTLSGLDPSLRYEFIAFGNRANDAYIDRITQVTISGIAHVVNQSSAGSDFDGPSDESTRITNGANTQLGMVTKFSEIDVGSDGVFQVTVSGGTHYLNAICLKSVPLLNDYITQIGFSNKPEGDQQDVTEFLTDENLYIQVSDVDLSPDLEPSSAVDILLKQADISKDKTLAYDSASKSFKGNISLELFLKGELTVSVKASNTSGTSLLRESIINIID